MLPEFLKDVFRSDASTTPRILPVVNRFSDWFSQSGLPFFKHYTDHSATHSLEVFRAGVEFISPASQRLVSARDLNYLLAAAFCHDAGMHLTEIHFKRLIAPSHVRLYTTLDEVLWPAVWQSFYEEAKRFSRKTLEQIFGDSKPVEDLPDDPSDYTDRHRRLIGEFLRRNHPRLSHDLALGLDVEVGLPPLLEGLGDEEKDLIGLIGRSHGGPIREHFGYIEDRFDIRDYNRTHIIYLMALLRIADYAQLQAHRASTTKSAIHPVVSPISQREWRVHNSVKNITRTHDDPEAVYVDANPASAADFLRLKHWLIDLQNELDTCWAVFGEVYGRQVDNGLSNLGFCLRRVRSSIFEKERSFQYLPEDIHFRVAEAEMLSLLLAPLYGDNPGYGVRELIQNAVDAVQEAVHLKAQHLNDSPSVRITTEIHKDGGRLIVEDNGVGMTASTVKDYFLNAGASFRSSMYWKKSFVTKDGQTAVVRSGRFGIGALAAFMVGDRIVVSTRYHLSQPSEGLHFEASLHDPQIEVQRKTRPIGTTIEISFDKSKNEALQLFARLSNSLFNFPEGLDVKYQLIVDGKAEDYKLASELNATYSTDSTRYFKADFVSHNTIEKIPDFVNGIAIKSLSRNTPATSISQLPTTIVAPEIIVEAVSGFESKSYAVHILDREGVAPINLARVAFTGTDSDLNDFIAKKSYEEILASVPSIYKSETQPIKSAFFRATPIAFLHYKEALCPADIHVMKAAGIEKLVRVYRDDRRSKDYISEMPDAAFSICQNSQYHSTKTSLMYRFRHINTASQKMKSAAVILKQDIFLQILNSRYIPRWLDALGPTRICI